jgi:hypothetical protein
MTLNQWKALALCLLAVFTTVIIAVANLPSAMAINSPISQKNISSPENSIAQNISSVSLLADLKSTDDWYPAIKSLVERYGVPIDNFSDRTFRPRRYSFRAEMASAMNHFSDLFNEIASAGFQDKADKEDLITAKRILAEIKAEIAAIKQVKSRG